MRWAHRPPSPGPPPCPCRSVWAAVGSRRGASVCPRRLCPRHAAPCAPRPSATWPACPQPVAMTPPCGGGGMLHDAPPAVYRRPCSAIPPATRAPAPAPRARRWEGRKRTPGCTRSEALDGTACPAGTCRTGFGSRKIPRGRRWEPVATPPPPAAGSATPAVSPPRDHARFAPCHRRRHPSRAVATTRSSTIRGARQRPSPPALSAAPAAAKRDRAAGRTSPPRRAPTVAWRASGWQRERGAHHKRHPRTLRRDCRPRHGE